MNFEDLKREITVLEDRMYNSMDTDFGRDGMGRVYLDTKKVNLGNMEEVYETIQTVSNALTSLHKLLNG